VSFSPDGKTILIGSRRKGNLLRGEARLYDSATGKLRCAPLPDGGRVGVAAFHPDGRTIVTGGKEQLIRAWDASSGKPIGEPLQLPGSVDAGAFTPNGKAFLAGCDNGTAQLWDVAGRKPIGEPFPHPGAVSALAISPDGRTFASACEDGMGRLWDLETRRILFSLPHEGMFFGVAFSPDGKTVLTGSRESLTARLWDVATGMPLGPPLTHPNGVACVAFSPDGQSFLTGTYHSDSKARLFRVIPELPDDLDRVATWVEVLTGLWFDPAESKIRPLDNAAWRNCREELERRGGQPVQQALENAPTDPFAPE
jgi:WD40 repeat protein